MDTHQTPRDPQGKLLRAPQEFCGTELPHIDLSGRTLSPLLVRWRHEAQLLLPMSPSPPPSRYNGPNLVLKYDRAQKRLVNIAVDKRSSPYYALRDRQGNAIGVTACDIDGDGREEIYFLNTNNAFSGKGLGPRASSCFPPPSSQHQLGAGPWGPWPSSGYCHGPPPLDIVPCCLQDLALSQQESPFSSCA